MSGLDPGAIQNVVGFNIMAMLRTGNPVVGVFD
jgi:hypothetical protein